MLKIPSNCTGCTACESVCPKSCIVGSENEEGFYMPTINAENCIECHLCEKVCPALNHWKKKNPDNVFVGQTRDEKTLYESSSGGIFSKIAKQIIAEGGTVYGVVIDYEDGYGVKHTRVSSIECISLLRGSKYVQSNLQGIFNAIKRDLNKDIRVLFSGTPCQVAGLKRFLRREYVNLLTVDVVCHGVPSPMVWKKYLEEEKAEFARQGEKNSVSSPLKPLSPEGDIVDSARRVEVDYISFRDKRFGWEKFGFALRLTKPTGAGEKNTVSLFYNRYDNPFMKGFLADLYLRPSCYNCPTKGFSSNSDITLADAWGIENYMNNVDLDKGLSVILAHTTKGKELLASLNIHFDTITDEILHKHNPAAYVSAKKHRNRKKFFKLISRGVPFIEAVEKCLPPPTYFAKIIWSINRRINKLLK